MAIYAGAYKRCHVSNCWDFIVIFFRIPSYEADNKKEKKVIEPRLTLGWQFRCATLLPVKAALDQRIMITRDYYKSLPSEENSIDDIVRWFMKCHQNACMALDMKSKHHKGSLEVSIGPFDSGEKRDPYLSIMHGSSWGFESFEQVSLELLLPSGEYDDACWFRVDSPDDPIEEWIKFCRASGIIHCLNVRGCKYNMDFGKHDG